MTHSCEPKSAPGFWMNETSGVLRPAIEAYLQDREMTDANIAAMRAYLRQWIAHPWAGDDVDQLRADIEGLTSQPAIRRWLDRAARSGIDPL